ncbi:MAG: hypothetical protein MK279_03200 [Gemmatimonadetes bacterium]|nr:hypothetical protein [Euryarchaeota archaeon]MCH2466911.1 hypothetical protein [Gemmatimonadota bacterium]MEC9015948.1 DUF4168 domain-containing protein [Gemmatimonadota bacterium]GIS79552.1 MAG: hypothetical protein CM1200mP14_11180 [Gammaproteobacteria bacterium]
MKTEVWKALNVTAVIVSMTTLLLVKPLPLVAQTQELPQVTTERMTVFVEAHIAISEQRDDFHAELGRTHELQERERIRARFQERIQEILTEHEMSQLEYDEITLVISIDEEQRLIFERILEELSSGGDSS